MANPNVLFRRGLQASLAQQTAIDGAFYLTTDTHRLYMGYNGGIHQVNPGITKVAKVADLPSSNQISAADYGQFFYAEAENILCIYHPTEGWVQINPDDNTSLSSLAISATAASGKVTVQSLLKEKDIKGTVLGHEIKDAFTVEGTNGIKVSASADGKGFVISAEDLVSNLDNVTLSSSVEDSVATIKLDAPTDSDITLKSGSSNLVISGGADEIILTVNEKDETVTLNAGNNATSGFDIKVTQGGKEQTKTIDPAISLNNSSVKFNGGVANIGSLVYDKAEIDSMIRGFQAMEYQGAVDALPSSGVKVGYMYVLTSDITSPVKAKSGDTIIARGTEGADGFISGTITWDVIPSGDDIHKDTVVSGATVDNGFKLTNSTGSGADAAVMEFSVAEGSHIVVEDAPSTGKNVVTVSHADVTRTDGTAEAAVLATKGTLTFNVVDAVASDDKGHITGITTKQVTVVDTNGKLVQAGESGYVATTAASADSKNAQFGFTVTHKDGAGVETKDARTLALATTNDGSLKLSAKDSKVYIDLVWEEWA